MMIPGHPAWYIGEVMIEKKVGLMARKGDPAAEQRSAETIHRK
jgi:hypothetical protein